MPMVEFDVPHPRARVSTHGTLIAVLIAISAAALVAIFFLVFNRAPAAAAPTTTPPAQCEQSRRNCVAVARATGLQVSLKNIMDACDAQFPCP